MERTKKNDSRRIMEVAGMMCLSHGLIHSVSCLKHVRGGIREWSGLIKVSRYGASVVLSSRDCLFSLARSSQCSCPSTASVARAKAPEAQPLVIIGFVLHRRVRA